LTLKVPSDAWISTSTARFTPAVSGPAIIQSYSESFTTEQDNFPACSAEHAARARAAPAMNDLNVEYMVPSFKKSKEHP